MTPRVSIIVPVYNGGRYILSALAGVQAQTFTDWELLIIDDGSNDDTASLLAQAAPDGRRRVFHQANSGRSVARNHGLEAAQGEIVAFLDVDDSWHPAYLAQMGSTLERAPEAVAAFCGWQYMDEAGRLLPQAVLLSEPDLVRFELDLYWRNSIMPSSLVARRQALQQAGGFDETLSGTEDWDMWLRLKAHGPFVAVPQVLTWYRTHPESTTENVAQMERERLKLHAKYLGSLDEPLANWPAIRQQAVGFTYFNSALGYLRHNDATLGIERIRRAVKCWPGLLEQDEFYYELGCAFQPRGLRGTAQGLDLEASAALIHEILFADLGPGETGSPQRDWGRACLVLARLARVTHNRPDCRAYALRALAHAPSRDRLRALRLLARSAVPEAWLEAVARNRRLARAPRSS